MSPAGTLLARTATMAGPAPGSRAAAAGATISYYSGRRSRLEPLVVAARVKVAGPPVFMERPLP